MFLRKYKDKPFFVDTTLSKNVFLTQLPNITGIYLKKCEWYDKLPYHERFADRKQVDWS
jgi:hypothetical protein